MPGLFQVKELEARKRALAAESEVYRQTLEFELRNIGLYTVYAKHRFSQASAFGPFVVLGMPAAGYFLGKMFARKKLFARKKRSLLARLMTTAVFGWKMYRKLAPFCRGLFSGARKSREATQMGGGAVMVRS